MKLFETKEPNSLYKKMHFIYFYNDKSKRNAEWDLMRFLAAKSFHTHNPDYEINFYTNAKPTGKYWERVSDYVKVHLVDPPTEVFGNPLVHPAHASDVFRIQILNEQGGVYSDFDTITVRSFDDLLAEEKFVVGKLGSRDWKYGNGVLISPPNSKYLQEWYQEYTWFRSKGKDSYWDEHSVKMHSTLVARESLQGHYKIVPWEAFYPYRYTESDKIYNKFLPDLIKPITYSVHLYDTSVNHKKIEDWTEERIKENPEGCSFSWVASKYLND
jgi:hypothetical protein